MALQIPEEHTPAISKLLKLPDKDIRQLIDAISSTTIEAEASVMTEKIAASVPGIARQDLAGIVDTLYSIYHVREFSEVSRTRFINDLVDALVFSPEFGLKKSDAQAIAKRVSPAP
jgi:hypothetical protein